MQNIGDKNVLDDLPESVITKEILARLPAEDVLRCRIVRKSWYHDTSTHDFLLAHHQHQPSLPVMELIKRVGKWYDCHLFSLCHTSPTSDNRELYRRTILWHSRPDPYKDNLVTHASCDGLLIISFHDKGLFEVCNPITRQRAPLPLLREHDLRIRRTRIAGFYQHQPSGGYHVLYSIGTMNEDLLTFTIDFYIIAVGAKKPRPIEQPPVQQEMMDKLIVSHNASFLYRGNLHWVLRRHDGNYSSSNIMVFDTMVETFRWMCRPPGQYPWMSLLELDGVLSMCNSYDGIILDIYGMHDYKAEVWALMYCIDLMALEASPPLSLRARTPRRIATLNEHEMLVEFPRCILHCDIGGKFLGKMECNEGEDNRMRITPFRFQENICKLPFFGMKEDYGAWWLLEEEGDDEKYYSIWP